MKKPILFLLILSVFLLSACDEKDTQVLTKKLQEADQTITQLKADIEKSQQELIAYKEKTDTKFSENGHVTSKVPYLSVDIETLFKKSTSVKLQDNKLRDESSIDYFISVPKTQFDWLDNLVIRQMLNNNSLGLPKERSSDMTEGAKDVNEITGSERSDLLKLIEKSYASDFEKIKDGSSLEQTIETSYLGQRENIVTFTQLFYSYTGGAHGEDKTNYINIDVNTQKVITLDTLIAKENQAKLKELLWQQYEHRNQGLSSGDEPVEPFTSKTDFEVVDNFYFKNQGVTFVFPPYAIGSHAEGEIELTIPWELINPILNADYQRVKKDSHK